MCGTSQGILHQSRVSIHASIGGGRRWRNWLMKGITKLELISKFYPKKATSSCRSFNGSEKMMSDSRHGSVTCTNIYLIFISGRLHYRMSQDINRIPRVKLNIKDHWHLLFWLLRSKLLTVSCFLATWKAWLLVSRTNLRNLKNPKPDL